MQRHYFFKKITYFCVICVYVCVLSSAQDLSEKGFLIAMANPQKRPLYFLKWCLSRDPWLPIHLDWLASEPRVVGEGPPVPASPALTLQVLATLLSCFHGFSG